VSVVSQGLEHANTRTPPGFLLLSHARHKSNFGILQAIRCYHSQGSTTPTKDTPAVAPGPLKPRYLVIRPTKLTVSSASTSVRNTATFLRSSSFWGSSVGQAVAVGLPLWWAALRRTRKRFEVHRRGVPHSNNLAPRSAKSQQPYYPGLPTCVKGS
jgi:hypothetical protein